VDHFVIVESNQTFTNNPKPWNFDIAQYPEYADKIIYIQVEDMPGSANPWDNEHHQRNAILRGLTDAEDDDVIIVSDVDELLRPEAVDYIRTSDQTIFALRMPLYNFKFNYMRETPGQYDVWAMAARRKVLDDTLGKITPNSLRELRHSFHSAPHQLANNGCEVIEHAGWHFGYFGDRQHLVDKAQNFSHQEVNRPDFIDQIDIDASIRAGTSWARANTNEHYVVVELDNYMPETVVQNQDRYRNYILDNATTTALAILPEYTYNN
jgi:beta-1,4-mannosyl-glycoprotein beta-1,4-N-acetylglucosaminyltransferase